MNQTDSKHKYPLVVLVFVIALASRWHGVTPPFDDLYHLKRISNFPPVIEFDVDRGERGAWCPWPPLYDAMMGVLPRVELVPPITFALFAAVITWTFGGIAGGVLAISPYLIGVSHRGAIDHHWIEPMLVVAILVAVERRARAALAIALTVAMFVQTALLVAAAIAFAIAFVDRASELAISFAVPAVAIVAWRLTLPSTYPGNIWFLGWAHAAVFAAAAIALATRHVIALAPVAPFVAVLASGANFFGGDPWLRSIIEFQPMLRDPQAIGTDIANLTGGALLAFTLWKRERTVAIFAIVYLLLALSSRRFLVPGIALFAIAGALAVSCHSERSEEPGRAGGSTKRDSGAARSPSSLATLGMTAIVLLPPLCYDAYALMHREPPDTHTIAIARSIASLPPGRVLAPWYLGHAIDVIGRHPVVIDNFGSMPDAVVFANANDALLQRHPEKLVEYMRQREIRYLVLTDPRSGLPAAAAALGIDPKMYAGTKLARSTVWWRLTHGQTLPGLVECSKTLSNPSGRR